MHLWIDWVVEDIGAGAGVVAGVAVRSRDLGSPVVMVTSVGMV